MALLAGCSIVMGDLPSPVDDTSGGSAGFGGTVVSGGAAGDGGAHAGDGGAHAGDGGAHAGDGGAHVGDGGSAGISGAGNVGNAGGSSASGGSSGGDAGAGGGDAGAGGAGASAGASAGGAGASGSGGAGGTSGDGGSAGGGAGGSGGCDPCDCDGDGVLSVACQGNDCNDNDANVKPGQMDYFLNESPGHGFDYDCVNGVEYEKPVGLSCNLLACDQVTQAFIGHPTCGTPNAPWGRCVADLLQCNPVILSYEPVKCH